MSVPVLRLGDTSGVSKVLFHTKDGSAVSKSDYDPVAKGKFHVHNGQILYHLRKYSNFITEDKTVKSLCVSYTSVKSILLNVKLL